MGNQMPRDIKTNKHLVMQLFVVFRIILLLD